MSERLRLIIEFAFGGSLFFVSIRSQLLWPSEILRKFLGQRGKVIYISTMIVRLLLGIVGAHLIFDPLIPGQATIHVYAPKEVPTLLENLRVRTAPITIGGTIDPVRMTHSVIAKDGKVSKVVLFGFFEQRVHIRLYDKTRPKAPLGERVIRLSPYVRRGFWDKHIYF